MDLLVQAVTGDVEAREHVFLIDIETVLHRGREVSGDLRVVRIRVKGQHRNRPDALEHARRCQRFAVLEHAQSH